MATQKFKTFYSKFIKERAEFAEIKGNNYKRAANVNEFLDSLIEAFISDIYESINQIEEKIINLEQIKSLILTFSESENLKDSVSYGLECVRLFENFQKEKKKSEKTGVKTNISSECGLILPISRFKTLIKSKSSLPKIKSTVPVFFAGFFESLLIKLLIEGFANMEGKTLKRDDLVKIIKNDNDGFHFLVNYV